VSAPDFYPLQDQRQNFAGGNWNGNGYSKFD